jgi:hypothetical protein
VREIRGYTPLSYQIKNASKYVNNKKVKLSVEKVQTLQLPDNNYDLVIAVSVQKVRCKKNR